MKEIRIEYYSRAFFIFLIAILYNLSIALTIGKLEYIWAWFVLLTVAICLFLAWPLLKTPKWFRIFLSFGIWIANIYILEFLLGFEGESNVYGIIYHILYFPLGLDSPMFFFSFFLIGTVIGDILFDNFLIEDEAHKKKHLKNNLFLPSIIISLMLIILGIFLPIPNQRETFSRGNYQQYPNFVIRGSFIWALYTIGVILLLFSILLFFEIYNLVKTKRSYRFLFYYSYYSFTIFLSHNILYFLFLHQLNAISIWIYVGITVIVWGLIFRAIYKSKFRNYVSIKIGIAKLSGLVLNRINKRKK